MKTDTSEGLSFLEGSVQFANGNCLAWLPAYGKSKPMPGLIIDMYILYTYVLFMLCVFPHRGGGGEESV